MKATLTILLGLMAVANTATGQDFVPATPDTALLNKMEAENDYSESVGYLYLKTNYKALAEKDSVKHYDWGDREDICAFRQIFENNIDYFMWHCEEGRGTRETLSFPKMSMETVRELINTLFYDQTNTWVTEYRYEPDGAGCFYEIEQREHRTIIHVYCGC